VDSEGKVQYDAIARVGHGKDKIIYTKLADMKGQFLDEQDDRIQKPDMDAIVETTEKTRQALEKLTQTKVGDEN
jgi:SNW domain-containing protein 1